MNGNQNRLNEEGWSSQDIYSQRRDDNFGSRPQTANEGQKFRNENALNFYPEFRDDEDGRSPERKPKGQQDLYNQRMEDPRYHPSQTQNLADMFNKGKRSPRDNLLDSMAPVKHHSSTIPKRGKRKIKTILDQKEHFKLKPQQCFHGNEMFDVHYPNKSASWEQAIECLEALGINMGSHKENIP